MLFSCQLISFSLRQKSTGTDLTDDVFNTTQAAFVFDVTNAGDVNASSAEEHNEPPNAKRLHLGTQSVEESHEGELNTP